MLVLNIDGEGRVEGSFGSDSAEVGLDRLPQVGEQAVLLFENRPVLAGGLLRALAGERSSVIEDVGGRRIGAHFVPDREGALALLDGGTERFTDAFADERRLEDVQELVATSEAVAGIEELVDLLHRIALRARELTAADFSAISVFGVEGHLDRFIFTGMDEVQARRLGKPPVGRGLLGALFRYDRPLRLDDLQQDARFTGWPSGHPDMAAFLGVPIRAAGETIGSLYMTRLRGRPSFSDGDEFAATVLALQVAIGVSGALTQERKSRVSLLEERVDIGHDLHDGMVQSLYALHLEWDGLLASPALSVGELRAALETGIERVRDVIGDIRHYIQALEADVSSGSPELGRDLANIVKRLVPDDVRVIQNLAAPALQQLTSRETEDLVFIAREAVSNAVRHGEPSKIAIDLRQSAGEIALTIQDDGEGFDQFSARTGLGSVTMRTRAERLGGDLGIHSVPGMGTTVRVALPRRWDAEPSAHDPED